MMKSLVILKVVLLWAQHLEGKAAMSDLPASRAPGPSDARLDEWKIIGQFGDTINPYWINQQDDRCNYDIHLELSTFLNHLRREGGYMEKRIGLQEMGNTR